MHGDGSSKRYDSRLREDGATEDERTVHCVLHGSCPSQTACPLLRRNDAATRPCLVLVDAWGS